MRTKKYDVKDLDYEITFCAALDEVTWEQFGNYCYCMEFCIENFSAFFDEVSYKRVRVCMDEIVSWYKKIHEETGRFNSREAIKTIGRVM